MTTNDYTKYLPIKRAFEDLFGSDAWYALKESNHIPTWRRYCCRTLSAISVAIEGTVKVYDEDWKREIDFIISEGTKRIKQDTEISEMLSTLAAAMIELSFLQIGHMPRRTGRRERVSLRSHACNLNSFRSVLYVQSVEQKEALFWSRQ